jgi:predicted ATP-grasp superfamily ATP-dependent carboligase
MGKTMAPLRAHADVARMHGSRDVVAASMEMMAGRLTPAVYLRSWRKPLVFAAFAKDDPVPGLVDLRLRRRGFLSATVRGPPHGRHTAPTRLRTSH